MAGKTRVSAGLGEVDTDSKKPYGLHLLTVDAVSVLWVNSFCLFNVLVYGHWWIYLRNDIFSALIWFKMAGWDERNVAGATLESFPRNKDINDILACYSNWFLCGTL